MKEIDESFLRETVAFVDKETELLGMLRLGTHPGEMDRVVIQFGSDGIFAQIAERYVSDERWHFFAVTCWRPMAVYLVRLWNAFPAIQGVVDLWLDDVATHPGLVFTLNGTPNQLALPDRLFLQSNSYTNIRKEMSAGLVEWSAREPLIFWRGVTTGYRSIQRPDWRDLPRLRLCALTNEKENLLPYDVGITHIVQIGTPDEINEIKNTGWIKKHVSQFHFADYQFSIDIDGNSNSWPGLFCKLLLGITVLKVESAYGYQQWYYHDLKPWVHFIPVASDMSDLHAKSKWAVEHKVESATIAKHASEFAKSLTVEQTFAPIAGQLISYLNRLKS